MLGSIKLGVEHLSYNALFVDDKGNSTRDEPKRGGNVVELLQLFVNVGDNGEGQSVDTFEVSALLIGLGANGNDARIKVDKVLCGVAKGAGLGRAARSGEVAKVENDVLAAEFGELDAIAVAVDAVKVGRGLAFGEHLGRREQSAVRGGAGAERGCAGGGEERTARAHARTKRTRREDGATRGDCNERHDGWGRVRSGRHLRAWRPARTSTTAQQMSPAIQHRSDAPRVRVLHAFQVSACYTPSRCPRVTRLPRGQRRCCQLHFGKRRTATRKRQRGTGGACQQGAASCTLLDGPPALPPPAFGTTASAPINAPVMWRPPTSAPHPAPISSRDVQTCIVSPPCTPP